MTNNTKVALVGLVWFFGGGALGGMTAMLFALGALGGMQTPPAWWWTVVVFGVFVLPLLLCLGWIPTAARIKKDKPALKFALISLALSGLVWLITVVAWDAGRPHY